MASVFRIATEQAIKEIVEENAVCGRFGLIITEENITEISKKVVDLFEMTLELRSKTQDIFGQIANTKPTPKTHKEETSTPFPKTKNASEIYSFNEKKKNEYNSESAILPHLDVKLPRKRFELTLEEKEKFMQR